MPFVNWLRLSAGNILISENYGWTSITSCNPPPTCTVYEYKEAHPHDYDQMDGIYCDGSTGAVRKV
jgi:hypothetical protein